MVVSSWTIYWVTRCDAIHTAATIFAIGFAIMASVWIPACLDSECRKTTLVMGEIVFVSMFVLSIGIAIFVPSTKQAAAIIVIPKIANSQNVKDLGAGVVELAKEWIVELKPKKMEK